MEPIGGETADRPGMNPAEVRNESMNELPYGSGELPASFESTSFRMPRSWRFSELQSIPSGDHPDMDTYPLWAPL